MSISVTRQTLIDKAPIPAELQPFLSQEAWDKICNTVIRQKVSASNFSIGLEIAVCLVCPFIFLCHHFIVKNFEEQKILTATHSLNRDVFGGRQIMWVVISVNEYVLRFHRERLLAWAAEGSPTQPGAVVAKANNNPPAVAAAAVAAPAYSNQPVAPNSGALPVAQPYGAPQYGAPQYGANPMNGGAPQYGAPPNGAPQYGAPPNGAPQYGAPPYGAPPYGAPPYGAPPYGAPPYGAPPYGAPPYGAPPNGAPQYGSVSTGAVYGAPSAGVAIAQVVPNDAQSGKS